LKKSSHKLFTKFVVIISFQIYERAKWSTPKIMVFYFESDIAKVYL
jgi:hypothetical protein